VSDPPAGFDDQVAQVADDVLFAHALEVDARSEIPASHLAALADAGLFAIAGPLEHGGLDLDARRQRRVRETLAGGCLTTAFVWAQHQSVVRRLRDGAAAPRVAWLADLCAGRRLGGIVLAGLLPGPARLAIESAGDGFVLTGAAPAVSGWGYVDVLLVAARREPGDVVVHALVEAGAAGLRAQPLRLAACNGSGTVAMEFDGVRVAAEAIVAAGPLPRWEAAGEGVRANGAFAIGVADRCARLCDEPALHAEVRARRRALDTARDGDELARARADASLFASRAAACVVAARGSNAIETREHAQRLAREAIFLVAFGQRPAIRTALLEALLRSP
jgi:alkylation response protein AidB-like acyl-CoA dehydrogenase